LKIRYLASLLCLYFLYVGSATALGIPAPATLATEAITANQARLNGAAISDTGQTVNVLTYFDLGTTSPPTDREILATPSSVSYPLSADMPYSVLVTGLNCETRYYYQAGLRTEGGIVFFREGEVREFTTQSCSPPPPQPIPTLSKWARIMMMFLMIATAGFYGWRIKQR
jgi:hypothetical protein